MSNTNDELKQELIKDGAIKDESADDSDRVRNFTFATKIDDTFSKSKLKQKLEANPNILKWAFCVHDKDEHLDGTKVDPHVHVYCQSKNTSTYKAYGNYFDLPAHMICKLKDPTFLRACQYLIHLNNPEKHQYDFEEVVANFNYQKEIMKHQTKAIKDKQKNEILDLIINGNLRRCDLPLLIEKKAWDKLILVKLRKDIDNAFKVRNELLNKDYNRNMEVIFIEGEAGTGKTTLAKMIAKKRKLSTFISGSSNDILDGYQDEECIILDDLRKESFSSFADILKLLDPYTSSKFKSRYYNKLVMADLIIITSTLDMHATFSQNSYEDFKQIERRIKMKLVLTDNKIDIYEYDSDFDEYLITSTIRNPINEYINKINPATAVPRITAKWLEQNL